jgi:hypothetical protein
MMIINIHHYLDATGAIAPKSGTALDMVTYLGLVIAAALYSTKRAQAGVF